MPRSYYSGVRIVEVRVSNFRSLENISVLLGDLIVLVGANNAGKTSFLEAMYAVIGSARRILGKDDIHIKESESDTPKDRRAIIDVMVRPVGTDGQIMPTFPAGGFWTNLWGDNISQDADFNDFIGIRTSLAWSLIFGEYRTERVYLKEWSEFGVWLEAEEKGRVTAADIEPLAMHYMDAQRDIDEDLKTRASFWRRLTDDLGLEETDIEEFELILSDLNQRLVEGSKVLTHLRDHLGELKAVVIGDSSSVEIAPVARRLRDLSKGVDISIKSAGGQSFPLTRHGMGTRSLASLLVFGAFVAWKHAQAASGGDSVHSVLGLEEPEAHLHPQAQRSLFSQIRDIPGQRIVSTHSPYFAGQASLSELRLFQKRAGTSSVSQLDLSALTPSERRKLERKVVISRGDLLFARAIILFEGETEEQSMPLWVEENWKATVHQLGYNCIGVGGGDYFPFIWLARALDIPWFIISDGEAQPVTTLNSCLTRAGYGEHHTCANVVVLPNGNALEQQLVSDGYIAEIEIALDSFHGTADYLSDYIAQNDGKPRRKAPVRVYTGPEGRQLAAVHALQDDKTGLAVPVTTAIRAASDVSRRIPPKVRELFVEIEKIDPINVPAGDAT